jgi:hypothetical protein
VAEGIASGSEELCSATRRERADRAETRVGFSDFWKLVSWGTGDEAGWRTEQDLRSGEGLDDDHRSATLGTVPKRAGLLGSGCFLFDLGLWYGAEPKTEWQESGRPPVGEEAEVANADEAFGKQVQQETAQELIEG